MFLQDKNFPLSDVLMILCGSVSWHILSGLNKLNLGLQGLSIYAFDVLD